MDRSTMVKQLTLFGVVVSVALIALMSFNLRSLHTVPRSVSAAPTAPGAQAIQSRNPVNYPGLASSFEFNAGQAGPRVRFIAQGASYRLLLTNQEAILLFAGPSPHSLRSISRSANLADARQSTKAPPHSPEQTPLSGSARGFCLRLVGSNPA